MAGGGAGALPQDGCCCAWSRPARLLGAPLKVGGTRPRSEARRPSTRRTSPSGSSKPSAPADVTLSSDVGTIAAVVSADLLEHARDDEHALKRIGYQIATVLARMDVHTVADAAGRRWARTPRTRSLCMPATGCTTAGWPRWADCPPSRTCTPRPQTAQPGDRLTLRLTAASSDATLNGAVRLRCPRRGWAAQPTELNFEMPARHHREADIELTVPADAKPGDYPVRAQLKLGGATCPRRGGRPSRTSAS